MKNALSSINSSIICDANGFISECENRFDTQIEQTVERIIERHSCDIVLLAGPSSSGKTTTAGKIAEKIRRTGRSAYTVSLDDFYLNRDDIPVGEDGMQDFEAVDALDVELIHKVFSSLINDRFADLPVFDFLTGTRKEQPRHIELKADDVIVVEGLHALNPVITSGLDEAHVFRVYISVSTRVFSDDGKVLLNKRNLRLARRIIRDAKHRNMSAEDTLSRWNSVRQGEDKYLFPFESNAEIKIDSFHAYEPCIFRQAVLDQLDTVGENSRFYGKACELRRAYESAQLISTDLLPEDSLLQEFLT